MGTTSFVVLGALLVVIQSSTAASVPQDGLSRLKRETVDEEVPVIYFPKATKGLRRERRDWIIPEMNFPENDKGPFPKKVSQIRSSSDATMVMHYSITGPGADQPPVGLFTMDRTTGVLYVTGPLDREKKSDYTFMAYAVAEGSGKGETPMEIKVTVIDQNDNRPMFTQAMYTGEVAEASPIGHEILKVTATDADEPGTMYSELRYNIISQDPKSPTDHMFAINPINGYIRVNAAGLDREKNPKYTLVVQVADIEGYGMVTTANVLLTVTDSSTQTEVTQAWKEVVTVVPTGSTRPSCGEGLQSGAPSARGQAAAEDWPVLEQQHKGFNMLQKELRALRRTTARLSSRMEQMIQPLHRIAEAVERMADSRPPPPSPALPDAAPTPVSPS